MSDCSAAIGAWHIVPLTVGALWAVGLCACGFIVVWVIKALPPAGDGSGP